MEVPLKRAQLADSGSKPDLEAYAEMKINKRLIMVGASGHGKVCAEIAVLSERYNEILFLDDDTTVEKCGEYDVVGTSEAIPQYRNDNTEFFVSIGNPVHRKRIQQLIESSGGTLTTLVHPQAVLSESVTPGPGTVVMPGAVINSDARIGEGCIVNTASSIDHDCIIGDYCHIAVGAHICGTVTIGENTWIGAGAVVSNNLIICENCMIGAGTVVVDDISGSGTYLGVPARKKENMR